MKKLIIIVTGLFLFCTSCDNDMITSQTEADANKEIAAETSRNPLNISNGKQVTKPLFFKNVTGTFEFMPNPELCTPYGGFMQAVAPGSGQGTHFGRFEVTNRWCINDEGDPISPILAVVFAANGDRMDATMINSEPDLENPPYEYLYYVIQGGTGRFDGATGSYTLYGVADFATLTWEYNGEGVITY